MSTTKAAILLSTYNGEKYLSECLRSLNNQDWPDITVFVRDDGSTDGTLDLLERWQANARSAFRSIPSDRNVGVAESFFRLLREAGDGFEAYAFSDQDDIWLPRKISRAMESLEAVPESSPALYCSRLEYVDEQSRHLQYSSIPRRIGFGNALVENIAIGCTIVMNRAARDLVLAHLPAECIMHDWWCYLTIACFGQIQYDEQASIKYRIHGGNKIGAPLSLRDDATRRLKRFFKSDGGVFRSRDQAEAFFVSHANSLPAQARQTLALMQASKTSLKQRLALAGSGLVWRQRWMDDLILRLLILMNRF
jgi:glycosyltransferase involved in cell wall biosynthesis